MAELMIERTITRLSLAIRLQDSVQTVDDPRLADDRTPVAEPIGTVNISLLETDKEAIKSNSGYYLFLDLPEELRKVKAVVKTNFYLDEEMEIDMDAIDPVNPVFHDFPALKPIRTYPFPDYSTLIRAVVRDAWGRAIKDVKATATAFQPESTNKAELGQGGAIGGESTVRLENIAGEIRAGDFFMIKDSDRERTEFCRIVEPLPADPANEPFRLEKSLKYGHRAGAPLYLMVKSDPVFETRTDKDGEMVLCFKQTKAIMFVTSVTFQHPDYQQVTQDDVEIREGRVTSIGVIKLASR